MGYGQRSNGNDNGTSKRGWNICLCVGIFATLGVAIAALVVVTKGFSAMAPPMNAKMMGQPRLCGGPGGGQGTCLGTQTCCGGVCRDLTTFKGTCNSPQTKCGPSGECPSDQFCCKHGTSLSLPGGAPTPGEDICRPHDWTGQCGEFIQITPVQRCDPFITCPPNHDCCHNICRVPEHPACQTPDHGPTPSA